MASVKHLLCEATSFLGQTPQNGRSRETRRSWVSPARGWCWRDPKPCCSTAGAPVNLTLQPAVPAPPGPAGERAGRHSGALGLGLYPDHRGGSPAGDTAPDGFRGVGRAGNRGGQGGVPAAVWFSGSRRRRPGQGEADPNPAEAQPCRRGHTGPSGHRLPEALPRELQSRPSSELMLRGPS